MNYLFSTTSSNVDFTIPVVTTVGSWTKVVIATGSVQFIKYYNKITGSFSSLGVNSTMSWSTGTMPDSLRIVDFNNIQVTPAFNGNSSAFIFGIENAFNTSTATSFAGYIQNKSDSAKSQTWYAHMELTRIVGL